MEISEAYGNNGRDRKALTTSLSKYPPSVLNSVATEVGKRVAAGEVKNPGAYCNRLGQVFTKAEREAQVIQAEQQRETFLLIVSTAEVEWSNGRPPERLREILLGYWPGEEELVEKAIGLVVG